MTQSVTVDPELLRIGKYAFTRREGWLLAGWHGPSSTARISRKPRDDHRAATCKLCDSPMDLVVRKGLHGCSTKYSSYRHRTLEAQEACFLMLNITHGARL